MMTADRARAGELAKLWTQTTTGGAPAASVNPTFFQHNAALKPPPSHFGKIAKPTGTYPKHWFKGGHPGAIASANAHAGIAAPTLPSALPPPGAGPTIT